MNKINIDSLINAASVKLGISPQALRNALNSGDTSAVLSRLSDSDRAKINQLMKDPAAVEKLSGRYKKGR